MSEELGKANLDDVVDKSADAEESGAVDTGWLEVKLEKIIDELITGNRPTGGGHDSGKYISIGGTQVNSEGYIELDDLVYIPEDYFEKVADTQLQKHDILVVKDGANTGDVAIAWGDNPEIVTNEHLFTVRVSEAVNSPYVFYYLLSHEGWKQMKGTITGSAQEGINKGFAGKIDIDLPPLSEQRKIASVLYNIDEAIRKTEEIIEQTERVKKGVMQEVYRGDAEHPFIGSYTEGWKIVELSEICDVHDAEHFTAEYSEDGIPVIRPGDLSPGEISLSDVSKSVDEEEYEELTRRYVPTTEDIVYSRSQNFAVASVVEDGGKFCIGQDMVVINTGDVDRDFLLHLLNSEVVRKQAKRRSTGTTFDRVNLGDIREYQIPVPDEETQRRMGKAIDSIEQRLLKESEIKNRLHHIKRALMQDLLTGEVRTKNRDIEVLPEVEAHG